jgi:hypothetical protein
MPSDPIECRERFSKNMICEPKTNRLWNGRRERTRELGWIV